MFTMTRNCMVCPFSSPRYKRLQTELADERASVFEVVDKGKQILHSVNCPALEGAVTSLADTWVDLNTDLTHELKR